LLFVDISYHFFFLFLWGGVRLSSLDMSAIILPIVPEPDDDDCGAFGEMIGRGSQNTRRKPAPVLLLPPQIPHVLTWTQTQAVTLCYKK
jgi:hypothetical protein